MSLYTNPVVLKMRKISRMLGINRVAVAVLSRGKSYEDKFESAMLNSLHNGDVVWDIGANIGFYSTQFAEKVGEGRVICFEPSSDNFKILKEKCSGKNNITIENYGLGSRDTLVKFLQGEDDLGALSRVVGEDVTPSEASVDTVQVKKADSLVGWESEDGLPFPSVVKIDTEGFELEVIKGMSNIMRDTRLRELFVEIHFRLLEQRGEEGAPVEIEKILKNAGFKCRWVDSSHIHGFR